MELLCIFFLVFGAGFVIGWMSFYGTYKKNLADGLAPFLDESGSVAWRKRTLDDDPQESAHVT